MSEDTTGKEPSGWMRLLRPSLQPGPLLGSGYGLLSVSQHTGNETALRDLSNLKVVDLRWASNASSCLGWYM